jgi:hypothetical protein
LRTNTNALLMGRLFDDRGNGMTPSHTCKQGVRYRYYPFLSPSGGAQRVQKMAIPSNPSAETKFSVRHCGHRVSDKVGWPPAFHKTLVVGSSPTGSTTQSDLFWRIPVVKSADRLSTAPRSRPCEPRCGLKLSCRPELGHPPSGLHGGGLEGCPKCGQPVTKR